jgi:uncharacterized phage protein (TIGR02220 family)
MNNKEIMVRTIVKNSPNLTFKKGDLVKWLIDGGKTEMAAKMCAYKYVNELPIKELFKGFYKLMVDPSDFISAAEEVETKKAEEKAIKSNEEAKEVIDYLNQITGSRYKLTASTLSKINARMKEGHKVEDFKRVIELKSKEWTGTKFEAYLRPETLFSTKFESYVNQKEAIRPQSKVEQMAGYDFTKYIKGA